MELTLFQLAVVRRLAAGDKLYTDTRRGYGKLHRDDRNESNALRVPFSTINLLERRGLIEITGNFEKRGEYCVHWLGLTEAGRAEADGILRG